MTDEAKELLELTRAGRLRDRPDLLQRIAAEPALAAAIFREAIHQSGWLDESLDDEATDEESAPAKMADDETIRRVEQARPNATIGQGRGDQAPDRPRKPPRKHWGPPWLIFLLLGGGGTFALARTGVGTAPPGGSPPPTIKGSVQLSAVIHAGREECQPIKPEDPAPCAWSPSEDALLFSYRPDEKLDTPFVGVVVAPLSGNGTARALELEPGQVSIRAPKPGPKTCNEAYLCSFYEGRPALGSGKHRVQIILSRDQLDQPTLLGASLTGREDLKIIEFQLEVIP